MRVVTACTGRHRIGAGKGGWGGAVGLLAGVGRPAVPGPEGGELVPASYTSGESNPLGVRYTILKREGADSVEVAPDAVFRSGDRIRLRVEVNGSGYLYIVHRGSSGVWKPLFPSPETAGGDNRVER